jgi:hypothetical protein
LEAEEIRRVLRISVEYFLKNMCDCGLLTSKKMSRDTLLEHFVRKREILEYLRRHVIENDDGSN